jgi:hypothetical protein
LRAFFFPRKQTAETACADTVGIVTEITDVAEVRPFAVHFVTRMTEGNAIHDETPAGRVIGPDGLERGFRKSVSISHHQHRVPPGIQNSVIRQFRRGKRLGLDTILPQDLNDPGWRQCGCSTNGNQSFFDENCDLRRAIGCQD